MKNSKIRKKLYAERSEAKKNTEKLKRALKSSILGPQNLGSGGGPGPQGPPLDPHLKRNIYIFYIEIGHFTFSPTVTLSACKPG